MKKDKIKICSLQTLNRLGKKVAAQPSKGGCPTLFVGTCRCTYVKMSFLGTSYNVIYTKIKNLLGGSYE
jgi:hypothetical protein